MVKTEEIKDRLKTAYPDSNVDVIDLTGGGSNYQVFVESSAFAGQSRIQQHQSVMGVFDTELKSGEIHAMTIKTKIK